MSSSSSSSSSSSVITCIVSSGSISYDSPPITGEPLSAKWLTLSVCLGAVGTTLCKISSWSEYCAVNRRMCWCSVYCFQWWVFKWGSYCLSPEFINEVWPRARLTPSTAMCEKIPDRFLTDPFILGRPNLLLLSSFVFVVSVVVCARKGKMCEWLLLVKED